MNILLFRSSRWKIAIAVAVALIFIYFYRTCYEVPILMYHRITADTAASGPRVSPQVFERQMEFLKVHGYHVMPLAELVALIRSGKQPPRKTVVITFDDGFLDNFSDAFPVLRKMDFPATIFMITRNIGESGWLAEEDLRILDEGGISIGSHTVSHAFLPKLDSMEVERELRESKQRLEEVLGHPVSLFSYPAGGVTKAIKEAVRTAGYEGAITTNYGRQKGDIYALRRIKASEAKGNLFNFWIKVSGYYHLGKKRIEIK